MLWRIDKVGDLWQGVLGPGTDLKEWFMRLEKFVQLIGRLGRTISINHPGGPLPALFREHLTAHFLSFGIRSSSGAGTENAARARPGSITEYIRRQGLLPSAEIDRLVAQVPTQIVAYQEAFAQGEEIPTWDEFFCSLSDDSESEPERLSLPVFF
jgi:hypothetical protein